jgi:predicted nucleotidyltransferase
MILKDRKRILRGTLKNFEDLPELHKHNFCLIKKTVQNFFNENVYVYGSFYWGHWDEQSDYDVAIRYKKVKDVKNELLSVFSTIKETLKNQHGLNVDILMLREEIGVLIP